MTVSKTAATPSTSERSTISKGATSSSPAIPSAQRLGNRYLESLLRARLIQAKLTVSDPQGMDEQQADRVADWVMGMAKPAAPRAAQPAAIVQRTCHQCEEELRRSPSDTTFSGPGAIAPRQALNGSQLQRFGDGAAEVPTVDAATENAIGSLWGRGTALPKSVRIFMESRFNADFGKVRVHTGAEADQLARAVNAQAFTVRDNIVFGAGQYKPDTDGGKRLLAHELTHVVQQGGGASVVQRAPLEGTARLDDNDVHLRPSSLDLLDPNTNAPAVPDIVSGSVTRRQYNQKNEEIHAADANVRFDMRNCTVTVPVGVAYREPTQADFDQFEGSNPGRRARALEPGAGRARFDRYLAVTNDRLNGWFAVKFGECKGAPCSGRTVPIVVQAVERTSNPDYTVAVLDAGDGGRSSVTMNQSVVLAGDGGDMNDHRLAHEAAHMALGAPDEYREMELSRGDPSRVREDFSLMADADGYRGWALLHERHFHFVSTFLEAALGAAGTPCRVTLEPLSRPKFDFRVGALLGASRFRSGWVPSLDAGFDVGMLSRTRNWRAFLEAHVTLMSSFDAASRAAFLLGGRVGIERRFTPSSGGLTVGGFVGAGLGGFAWLDTTTPQSPYRSARLGFGEVGARVGHGFAPGEGLLHTLFVDAAAGSTLNFNDPSQQHWFRVGLGAALEF